MEHAFAYALLDMMTALEENVADLYDDIMGNGIHLNYNAYGDAASLAWLINNAGGLEKLLKDINQPDTRDYLLNEMGADDEVSGAFDTGDWNFDNRAAELGGWVSTSHQKYGEMALQVAYQSAIADTTYTPQPSQYPSLPKSDPGGTKFHVIRMVYEQPHCFRLTISQPTRAFQFAPFFDPDAPVRPVRIAMPVDTTIEGLKKFDKGVAFLISNQLKAQMNRVAGLQELMDGDTNPEGTIDLGMICSLSIPIITICALILLMIIVSLLNIIFQWLPFFKICLPIPLPRSSDGGS
jgi:hypothetical protein